MLRPSQEKVEAWRFNEEAPAGDAKGLNEDGLPSYDPTEVKRVLRKVDLRLLPMLTALYLLAFLDRGNIGNAKVAGMNAELGLTGTQYNIVLSLFFIPYTLFDIPSNIALKLVRPSVWISILVTAWGVIMACHASAQSFGGLAAARTTMGIFEAGFFPAASYLLGEWYCRFELQWRLSIFFSAASLAGAFSGLLASGLQQMDGLRGISGWRWIFIVEGAVTVLVGLLVLVALPSYPATCTFLTDEEKIMIRSRLEQDSGTSAGRVETEDKYQWKTIKAALMDWRIWFTVFIYWGHIVTVNGFTFTAPTIILELGYTSTQAQLLTVPVYALGVISTLLMSWLADKSHMRWPFIVGPYALALCGFIGLMAIPHPRLPGLTYAFLFTIPAGVHPSVITLVSWISNNLAPSWKRAIGLAISIMVGNLGGLIGSNIYLEREAPSYWTGYGVSAACLVNAIICTFILRYVYARENAKRDKMSEAEIRSKYTEQELLDMGDRSPLFRYVT